MKYSNLKSSALKNAGFEVVQSYCHPTVFKTNADQFKIFELINELFGDQKKEKKFDMTINLDVKKALKDKVARFLPNPEKNWGPKSASKIKQSVLLIEISKTGKRVE